MRYDHQLYLYLDNFHITALDQLNVFKDKCALCRHKLCCVTVEFTHIKSGHTITRNLCGSCRDMVRTQQQRLLSHEEPYE